MSTRPELSYDGQGVNGPELSRERLATFTDAAKRAPRGQKSTADHYGPMFAAAPDLIAACDPDTLEVIAAEIDCFEHSARAAGLRLLAKRQRTALRRALTTDWEAGRA